MTISNNIVTIVNAIDYICQKKHPKDNLILDTIYIDDIYLVLNFKLQSNRYRKRFLIESINNVKHDNSCENYEYFYKFAERLHRKIKDYFLYGDGDID